MSIEFRIERERSRFFNPVEGREEELEIEIRFDPLTKKTSRIVKKPLPISQDPDILKEVEKKGFCPFCPENIYNVATKDTRILSEGRLEKGEAILFPNISPYSSHSLVVRITNTHYLSLDEFTPRHFIDAFEIIQDYISIAKRVDEKAKYASINMNYLKPAGSSIVHPHIQVMISGIPTDYHRRIFEAGKKFYQEYGRSYWEILMEQEQNGPRLIGRTDIFTWITAFAPRGFDHVTGISPKNFMDFSKREFLNLSEGITRVLRAYKESGYNSFNFTILIPPLKEPQGFATLIDIVARSNLDRYYWNDCFFLTKLHDEGYASSTPEEVAKKLERYF